MKQIVFLLAQTIVLATAFAQPPATSVEPAGLGNPQTLQELQMQRRNELRSVFQSQRGAQEQAATERRLSPEERAELREQVRQQIPRRPARSD